MKKTGIATITTLLLALSALTSLHAYYRDEMTSTRIVSENNNLYNTDNLCTSLSRDLFVGKKGNDVKSLQRYLSSLGYFNYTISSYYGVATKNAVASYQRDNNLYASGKVLFATRESVNEEICEQVHGNVFSSDIHNVSGAVVIPETHLSSPSVFISPSNTIIPQNNNGILYYSYDPFAKSNGPLPLPATLTVTTPSSRTTYKEGDTVSISWSIGNANPYAFTISLESNQATLSKVIMRVDGNQRNASFVITKEILEAVCGSGCVDSNQSKFNIAVKSDFTQGNERSSLTALVSDITITRTSYTSSLVVTVSKSPINNGETASFFVSPSSYIATSFANNNALYMKVRASCQNSVAITINGQSCGVDNYVYVSNLYAIPEVKATIVNTSFGPQQVFFEFTLYSSVNGVEIGKGVSTLVVNR